MPHRVWNLCACFSLLILQGNQCFWLAENLLQPIRGTTQIWLVTRHQYGFSALLSQTSLHGETSGGVAKCQLFSKATDLYKMSSFWSTNKISFSILVLGIIIRGRIKYFTVVLFWKESYYRGIRIIAKFVVSRCTFANFEFLFRQSFEWGRVNANHNATHSLSLAGKNKTENDSRLLKNSEGNHDDEWNFCRGQEADIALFFQCKSQE